MEPFKISCQPTEKLFLIFKTAIEREQEAQNLYKEAQVYCEDLELKELFKKLQGEELTHEETLQALYNQLRACYETDGTPKC